MTEKQRDWASVAWHNDDAPYATRYRDGYFGEADPIAEAQHVFCKGLALPDAWEDFFLDRKTFRIVELGFGTGLNFLQTARLWKNFRKEWRKKTETQNKQTEEQEQEQEQEQGQGQEQEIGLDYWGIERHPLRLQDMQRFYRQHEVEGAEQLLKVWKELSTSSCQTFHPPFVRWQIAPSLRLTLLLLDVETALARLPSQLPSRLPSQLPSQLSGDVDGWYCDGFAPQRNPAMWSEKVFSAMARVTRARENFPQLASFSVAKSVRTTADAYGFRTRKRKGLLTKREVLQGFFERASLVP